MKRKLLSLLFLAGLVGFLSSSFGQGVTTSALTGKIINENGEAVAMANVVAIHTPSGTQYGTITQENGQFDIRNMRIGGPYQVVVTYVGYQDAKKEGIFLQLNKTAEANMTITKTVAQLEEVVIAYSKNDVINEDRTGSMTNVDRERIAAMPTIKRSSLDLTRLTPESNGNSFGGRNNLYNNFSLDGSIFNNSFGLDYATPGGQTDAQPVSLDAIDQIQVSLAPFDVREGGFTGAGVNAVTKSGTNTLKGTGYYFFRNEKMIGEKVRDVVSPNLDFSASQYGVSLGGPIITNKLFFFVNAEAERRNQLAHGYVAQNDGNKGQANVTSVLESDIKAVQDRLLNYWGYDPGAYQKYYHETYNNKLLVKLDYNFAKNHNLTLRYNMLDAYKDILPHPEAIIGRGPTIFRLPFEKSSYRIFNKIHSVVGEVNSIFSSKLSNKLLVGFSAFRDHREPHSAQFPVIDIFDNNGNLAITMGSEMFSTHNILNQNVYQFTDNLTYYTGKHTITAGLNFERFWSENSFNLFYYPWNMFFSVEDFLNNTEGDIDFNAQVSESNQKDYLVTYLDVAQLAFYIQDEYKVNDKLNLTLGVRTDIPMYFNEIPQTDATDEASNFEGWVDENGDPATINTRAWPKSIPLWSPRVGFNYDVKNDNMIQLRGGTGIFSGRIPFVWLGNQSSNPGMGIGYTFQINATAEDFHFPQVWKSDLAVDAKMGNGWLMTLEGVYGKDINAVVHRNYNMLPPTGKLSGTGDNREVFAGFNEVNIYSSSENSVGFLDAGAIVLTNTDKGYQYSVTGKLAKAFDFGLIADVAYTYMQSKDYTSIPAEIAADAFQRNPVIGNPNFPMFSWSRYGLNHRAISSAMYKTEYKNMATSFAFFFEAGQGNRYSYVYAGDLNGDAIVNNDLIYVPDGSDDINFGSVDENGVASVAANAADQWASLDEFIAQDKYLSARRGMYAERNGASLPWFTQLDFRVAQDFAVKVKNKKNTMQLSLDILNMGNLINSNWGVRQFARTYTPISLNGVDSNGIPYYQFDTNLTSSYVDDFSIMSKWQIQFGVRYMFE